MTARGVQAPRFGVVTGLELEARIIRRTAAGRLSVRRGLGPRGAAAAATALIDRGCQALVSFGLAGGLAPSVRAGDVLVADQVVTRDGKTIDTDEAWRGRLLAAVHDSARMPRVGRLAGSDRPVATVEGKLMLHQATHALAVDMESHEVAAAAQRAGLPLIVLRVVADPAGRPVPMPVLAALTPDGGIRPSRLAGGIVRAPWLLPAMFRVAADGHRAMRSLRVAARLLDEAAGGSATKAPASGRNSAVGRG